MVVVQKLTAEALISAPRRGPALPSSDGRLALYSVSTHVFDEKTYNLVRVMNIASGATATISEEDGVHDAVWIPQTADEILYLKSRDKGRTQALVASGSDVAKEHYVAAEFDAPVANLKLKALDDGSVAFFVTGLVEDGRLYNETIVEKKSSARVFDTPNVRMWNELYRPQRYTLWYNTLEREEGKWRISGDLLRLIDDPTVEVPQGMYAGSPSDSFDICQRGVAFIGRDVSRQQPHKSSTSVQFYVPIESFKSPPTREPVRILSPSGTSPSLSSNIRFSPDGRIVAFLNAETRDFYNTQLCLIPVGSDDAVVARSVTVYHLNPEHEPPASFEFAGACDSLIIHREKCGRSVLDQVDLGTGRTNTFFQGGVVGAFHPLRRDDWDKLLVTSSSFIDSSLWQIARVSEPETLSVSSATKHGAKFGLSANMVSDFWFEGSDGVCVHSFMIKPSDFDPEKKYPWVLRPHGGPVSSWSDSWSIIANFAAWAEQGYVVILPNISGSKGYGVEFSRRVRNEWGGKPFEDLLNLISYLEDFEFLDQSKAVLMGGSYGGYLVNWFQGHDIIKMFCCAVCHDGIFSNPSFALQEDLLVDMGDYGDSRYPWENPENMERWSPARPELLRNWVNAPPTLIIHSEKDYRCPITEGLAAFNTLQAMKVPSRFLTFPDEGHWVEEPENSLEWHRVVWDWVRRCVDGEITRGSSEWCRKR